MLKKIILITLVLQFSACNELQQVLENSGTAITSGQIANGLKEALDNGIQNQVTNLATTDGFFKNKMVKIHLPQELQKVDKALRDIGLSNLADEGLKVLNRAAEDAVGEAIPIFKEAIVNMTFTDAKNILMGDRHAATQYLETATSSTLQSKFTPVVQNSFQKVGADKIWTKVINTYNQIPFVNKVNPNLTTYTTDEALKGVYKMVAVEEVKIRTDIRNRSSDLLKKVFALQDKK